MQLLRTVSNPDLNTLHDRTDEKIRFSVKLSRSLSCPNQNNSLAHSFQRTTVANAPWRLSSTNDAEASPVNSLDEDSPPDQLGSNGGDDDLAKKMKHSKSEPIISANDDDDDVWCNPEDEDHWKHCVEMNQQRQKQLRDILGNDTIDLLQQALRVRDIRLFTAPFDSFRSLLEQPVRCGSAEETST